MDIATIAGIIAGLALIIWGIGTGNVGAFINIPSILIVVGGTLGAVMVSYPLRDILQIGHLVRKAFAHKKDDPKTIIPMMVEFGRRARKDGILALEALLPEVPDPFIRRGLQMAVDGMEPQAILKILELELETTRERHKTGADIVMTFGIYAPAFGMIGTLIGLVLMLQSMDNPSTIGPNMAIALITTFYGAVMANLIFLPMAGKLRKKSGDEMLGRELAVEGIISIATGDNPRLTEQKLNAFLIPKLRESVFK